MHPTLKQGLKENNFKYVTELQKQAIDEGIMESKHMIVRSTNGSGKTLSYLLPILNSLYNERAGSNDDISFRISKKNEDFMFQNAT